jgi:hypothetical protein
MNHAVTIGGLLLTLGAAAGLLAAGIGVIMFFAGAMSDDPYAADSTGKTGCVIFVIGAVALIGCIVATVL